MPIPVSVTEKRKTLPTGRSSTFDNDKTTLPFSVNLTALLNRLVATC